MRLINYISGNPNGGANSAAVTLSQGFKNLGYESLIYNFRTKRFEEFADDVRVGSKTKFNSWLGRGLTNNRQRKFTLNLLNIKINLNDTLLQNSIGILHYWSDGGPSSPQILELAKKHKVFFIVLRDLRMLTGGCHYPLDCSDYHSYCSKCEFSNIPSFFLKREISYARQLLALNNTYILTLNDHDREVVLDRFAKNPSQVHNIKNVVSPIYTSFEERTSSAYDVIYGAINQSDLYKGPTRIEKALPVLKRYRSAAFGVCNDDNMSNIDILGKLSSAELKSLMLKSNYILVPSLRETFNKVVAEAICCGCYPIVFRGSIGPESIVRDIGFGSIISGTDEIELILNQDIELRKIHSARIKASKVYSAEKIAQGIMDIL